MRGHETPALCSLIASDLCVRRPQLERLVANRIDPNLGDYDGRTALHLAAAAGAQKSVEYLLSHGADVNRTDRWGGLPLMDAVKSGHALVAAIIGRAGGRLQQNMTKTGAGKLCDAAAVGDVRMMTMLVEAGVEPDQGDYDRRYPLHVAAAKGKLLAVSYLLSTGANPNVLDRWSCAPLEDALCNGNHHCAVLLKAYGGKVGPSPSAEVTKAAADLAKKMEDATQEARDAVKAMHKMVSLHPPSAAWAPCAACQCFRPVAGTLACSGEGGRAPLSPAPRSCSGQQGLHRKEMHETTEQEVAVVSLSNLQAMQQLVSIGPAVASILESYITLSESMMEATAALWEAIQQLAQDVLYKRLTPQVRMLVPAPHLPGPLFGGGTLITSWVQSIAPALPSPPLVPPRYECPPHNSRTACNAHRPAGFRRCFGRYSRVADVLPPS